MSNSLQSVLESPTETLFVSGRGLPMQAVHAMIAEIAPTDIAILLVGESGTGKDTYAKFIHRSSRRPHAPLKKVSCATLDSSHVLRQVQDFLHGHVEGALFLDGIEELDLPAQRALASLLPDDAPETPAAQVRLICSTSADLERSIEAGRFRRELYFRINGTTLRLPPLRERHEDIPALVAHFLARYASPTRALPVLDHESLEVLATHAWPGNIRELENIAKKIAALADPRAALSELRVQRPSYSRLERASDHQDHVSSLKVAARAASRRTERELILKALERTHWNRKRAAQELQISYKSLLYKIKQIQVPGPGPEEL